MADREAKDYGSSHHDVAGRQVLRRCLAAGCAAAVQVDASLRVDVLDVPDSPELDPGRLGI